MMYCINNLCMMYESHSVIKCSIGSLGGDYGLMGSIFACKSSWFLFGTFRRARQAQG
jgi:hypothetical protein